MKFVEAVNLVNNFEKNYDVMSVKAYGIPIWPFIRLYLIDSLSLKSEKKVSSSSLWLIIRSLFAYNPFCILKRKKVWVYNSSITRKCINGKYFHHVSGAISEIVPDILMFEQPDPSKGHYPKKKIPEKNIVSSSWDLMIVHIIEIVLRFKTISIENESVLKSIINDNDLSFNYNYYIRLLKAQKVATSILLLITHKPDVLFVECPYTQMGKVWAFHMNGVTVIELQHGVISKYHPAYNSHFNSGVLSPDTICLYGDVEYEYFTKVNKNYCKNVVITGLYMLECAEKFFKKDIFEEFRMRYESVVVVAGQSGQEKVFSCFIDKIAQKLKNVLFVYIPRRLEKDISFKSPNVIYRYGVNIYEYLKWCDIHTTITSTTCLEAHYFYKPTIFFSIGGVAKDFYGNILRNENGGFYINDEDNFIEAYKTIINSKFQYKELFAHDTINRFKTILAYYKCL